jgi:copper transport protein
LTTPPRRFALVGAAIGVLVALLLPASPASAHAILERADPPSGTVVPAAPADVVLTFTEPVRPVADKIRITGPDGKRADTGTPTTRDRELRIPLRSGAANGTYLVSYRVISADGHPVGGGLSFSVGEVSNTPTESAGQDVRTSPPVAIAIAASRWVGFAGLVLLVGPGLMLVALWPRRLSTAGPARLAMTGVGLVTLGTLAELYLQIPYTSGTGIFSPSSAAARDVLGTQFAAAHLVRLGVLAAVTLLLRPLVAGQAGKVDQTLLVILGLVGLATWPISGHPSASPVPALTVVADVAHLAAMAAWLGGLVMLFAFLLRRASDRELSAILPVWSGWAMFAVTVLVLAGTAQALVEIGTLSALTGTTYGRLVLVKVALLALVLAAAGFSRRMVNRYFTSDVDGSDVDGSDVDGSDVDGSDVEGGSAIGAPAKRRTQKRLRLGVLSEVAIAVVVLGVTAALVQTTPARTTEANANAPTQPFAVTLTSTLFRLEVDVAPTSKGVNTIHLFAYKLDGGGPQTVVEWKATAALPAQGIEPVAIPLLAVTPDHAAGQVLLPSSGLWEMRFTVRTDETHQASVTTKVPIR